MQQNDSHADGYRHGSWGVDRIPEAEGWYLFSRSDALRTDASLLHPAALGAKSKWIQNGPKPSYSQACTADHSYVRQRRFICDNRTARTNSAIIYTHDPPVPVQSTSSASAPANLATPGPGAMGLAAAAAAAVDDSVDDPDLLLLIYITGSKPRSPRVKTERHKTVHGGGRDGQPAARSSAGLSGGGSGGPKASKRRRGAGGEGVRVNARAAPLDCGPLTVTLPDPPADGANNSGVFISFKLGDREVGSIASAPNGNGVTLTSSTGDFAEMHKKLNAQDEFKEGEILFLQNAGGAVSRGRSRGSAATAGIVTRRAIVQGSAPRSEQHCKPGDFETIAYNGRVPVLVRGPIRVGDRIGPAGAASGWWCPLQPAGDGVGEAVRPSLFSSATSLTTVGKVSALYTDQQQPKGDATASSCRQIFRRKEKSVP